MYKKEQVPEVLFGNVQIQPCKFEPLESGNDSVDIYLSGSDSTSEQDGITMSTTKESTVWMVTIVSLSDYVENCCLQIRNRLVNKVHFRVFASFYFAKDVYNFFLSA